MPTSPRASNIDLPCSIDNSWAKTSWFSKINACILRSNCERSRAVVLRNVLKRSWAISMARRVSSRPQLGTVPMISPVAGLLTSKKKNGFARICAHPLSTNQIGLLHELFDFCRHFLFSSFRAEMGGYILGQYQHFYPTHKSF